MVTEVIVIPLLSMLVDKAGSGSGAGAMTDLMSCRGGCWARDPSTELVMNLDKDCKPGLVRAGGLKGAMLECGVKEFSK